MGLTQETMDTLARRYFLPIMLLLDYAMCHYLVSLFLGSFLGFTTLITFGDTTKEKLQSLNDVSETCSQLVFLVQITIIGYAVQTKVRLRSIRWFTLAAEILIIADWINVAMNFVELFGYQLGGAFRAYNNFLESFTLMFVLVFRFYYLSMTKSLRGVLRERRLEFTAYVLVVTHEYVFMIFEHATGVSWEYVQGIYMRTTIASCLVLNVVHKRTVTHTPRPALSGGRHSTSGNVSESDGRMANTHTGPSMRTTPSAKSVIAVRKATNVVSPMRSPLGRDPHGLLPDGDF